MAFALKNKVGFINDGFELDRPLDKETYRIIVDSYSDDWRPAEDMDFIEAIGFDEHYKAEVSLQKLIDEVIKPRGYILNGEAVAQELDYDDRFNHGRVWRYIVKDNVLVFVSEMELEENAIIEKLKNADDRQKIAALSDVLAEVGYKKVAEFLKSSV